MAHNNWLASTAGISALALVSLWAQGAAAQENPTVSEAKDDALVLEEVLVTARKFSESLQDAPVAVTTISGNTLELRGIRGLGEMTKLASSVKFDSDADVRAGVSIRGVGGSSDVNAAPGVGLFVDGIYQPASAYYTVPFFDVERIEVLKGPQGTLYGKNTMGGAINILSREPNEEIGGSLMVEAANDSHQVGNAVINLPFADNFGNRTAIFYRESDGPQKSKTTGENALAREDIAVRTRFVYEPDNGFKSSLSLFYADLESTPFAYSETNRGLNDPIDNVTKDENGSIVSEYKSANFTNSFDFGTATVTSLTSYDIADVDTLVDADFSGSSILTSGGISERDTFAQEIRLADSGTDNSDFHWLVGAYYNKDKLSSTSQTRLDLGPALGGIVPLSIGEKKEDGRTYAAFGQASFTIDKFEFVAGLRYDNELRKNDTTSLDGLPFTGYVSTTLDREVSSREWQPKISVSYHHTPDAMVYGTVSRGFRAGGFNAITAPPEFASYETELTTSYEIGLKSELFDRRLRLNSALFYTDYTDILQTDAVSDGTALTIISRNGGEARSYGFELDATYKVSQELTLTGGYTYLDIKNDEIPFGLVRREVSGFPPHTFNAQADYFRTIGDGMSIGAHLSANYVSEIWMGTETEKRDAQTLVDASLDFTIQAITISVFGKNIFDEEYYLSYIPDSVAIAGTALGILNAPAQYGVRLSASF